MAKGSWRRPTQVSEEEAQRNWDRIFPPKKREQYDPPPLREEQPEQ